MSGSAKRRLKPGLWLLGSGALLAAGCATSPRPQDLRAAAQNAQSLYAMPLDLFGRAEPGWAIYAPRVEATVGSASPADATGFAHAVDRWRRRHEEGSGGAVDAALLAAMKADWQAERPFVRARLAGVCPPPPAPEALTTLEPGESYGGRPLKLRSGALQAYRRMVRAARREQAPLRSRPDLLTIFSAYRSPERDAARCAAEGNCQGVVRAACSAHRTGLAVDLVLDTAPGAPVDSSADANRLTMAQGLAYRWLVANAPRFGFVNYAFEPWHWEWTGERP